MADKDDKKQGLSAPILGMLVLGIASAVVVAACFVVIRSWPQPESVAPYFGGRVGFAWGGVVGGVVGLIIGFLTDDKHFSQS